MASAICDTYEVPPAFLDHEIRGLAINQDFIDLVGGRGPAYGPGPDIRQYPLPPPRSNTAPGSTRRNTGHLPARHDENPFALGVVSGCASGASVEGGAGGACTT
jgi:hypothetical protein